MKRLLLAFTLVGIVACSMAGFAQTTSPTGDAVATAASAAQATDATPPAAEAPAPAVTANSAPAVETPPPASIEVAANEAPAPEPAAAPAAADGPRPGTVGTVIPLIVMDDVPLTDAIRNLARQAGINHQLDPKTGLGQPGPDGKMTPQPNVTIRWENITAEQALNALLNNHDLQLVEDTKSKIARVTNKDPAALPPLVTKIYQLKYASPSNVLATVQASIDPKRSKAMPDIRTSQLVVVATEQEMVAVDALIESLDTKTRQVLIEARLLETIINPKTMKGIDWSGTLKEQNITFGNGVTTGTTTRNSNENSSRNSSRNSSQNSSQSTTTTSPGASVTTTETLPGGRTITTTSTPDSETTSTSGSSSSSGLSSLASAVSGSGLSTLLSSAIGSGGLSLDTARGFNPATFFLNADGLKATLSFLNEYSETKVISSPRTVTLDNETATIEVGTLWPIVNTTAGTANTTGGSQITYSNLTVMLKVTPRISANNLVKLQVAPRVVRLGSRVPSIVGGVVNEVDSFNTRELLTSVLIPSGNTLVMGGLIQDEISNGNTKVPLLGDLPILGLLFRSDTKNREKSNLIVFLTPTIVEDEDYQPTKSDFLRTKVPVTDSIEADWSAWDSGKPKDWSKKKMAQPQELPQEYGK